MRDGKVKGGVGVGQHRNPLVGVDGGPVVEIRGDVDGPDPQLTEPVAKPAGQLAVKTPGGGLGIATPEQDPVAVVGHVRYDVANGNHLSQALASPHVFGAPVPTFPTVGVTRLQRVAAQQPQQSAVAAVGGVDDLGLAVAVRLRKDRFHAIAVLDPVDLLLDNVERLFPGNALVLACAPALRVAAAGTGGARSAIRVPVDALQWMEHSVRGMDTVLVTET